MRVQLKKRVWELGETVGQGGFGSVRAAWSEDRENMVAKLVPKVRGADRELLFAGIRDVRNVVPVIDNGEAEGCWVIVMPRAEMSLQDLLDESASILRLDEAVPVLLDVADALSDMYGKVVHRDIKPANILRLDGRWCLADFGISRYAEAATAAETRKFALSSPWAAPERWRAERATEACDVYSLGVVAYELLSGKLPFGGPEQHDYRDQHLHATPEPLTAVPSAVWALVSECLSKAPGSRPSPSDFAARLRRRAATPLSGGLAALAEAHAQGVQAASEAERQRSRERSEAERMSDLVRAAKESLGRIGEEMREAIAAVAPSARIHKGREQAWDVQLQQANLVVRGAEVTLARPWEGWEAPAVTVVAHASVGVTFPPDGYGYGGRSHSLWFCDAVVEGQFAWFETAFCFGAFTRQRSPHVPFALPPGEESAKALWTGLAEYDVARPFERLTPGELEPFIARWAGWLAAAAGGALARPSVMPEGDARGSWRRR